MSVDGGAPVPTVSARVAVNTAATNRGYTGGGDDDSPRSPDSANGDVPHAGGGYGRRRLARWCRKLSFGVGHFYNDLCAALWFSYLLIFFKDVVGLSATNTGTLMLIGQVTDGLATPLVGLAVDRVPLPLCLLKMGRRKAWHLFGTFLVTISFPLVFNGCLFDPYYIFDVGRSSPIPEMWKMVYYAVPIMVFQIGWAAVQIAHLSMIPEMARCESERTALNSLRYVFTMIANSTVYLMLYGLLKTSESCPHTCPHDLRQFANADYIIVALGLFAATIFHFGTPAPRSLAARGARDERTETYEQTVSTSPGGRAAMAWRDWFKHVQFYQVGLLYTLSRMFVNVSQMFFPFFVQYAEKLGKTETVILQLTVYVASFVMSNVTSLKLVNKRLDRKLSYSVGCVIGLSSCAWYFFMPHALMWQMVGATVISGLANSLVAVGALSLTADLIRKDTESGAFVYGCMSFADKVANGAAAQTIQSLQANVQHGGEPCDPAAPDSPCGIFYHSVQVFVPGGCLLLALALVATLLGKKVGHRPRADREFLASREALDEDDGGGGAAGYDNDGVKEEKDTSYDSTEAQSSSSGVDNYGTPTSSVQTTPDRQHI